MAIDKILTQTIKIGASTSKVWNALTNPAIIKQWLFGTIVISDWTAGSPILFTGKWQGTDYCDKGVILQFEKENIFQYSYWSGFSGLPDVAENYSIITFTLVSAGNNTLLTLTQTNFPTISAYEHTVENWKAPLDSMKNIIEKQTG